MYHLEEALERQHVDDRAEVNLDIAVELVTEDVVTNDVEAVVSPDEGVDAAVAVDSTVDCRK